MEKAEIDRQRPTQRETDRNTHTHTVTKRQKGPKEKETVSLMLPVYLFLGKLVNPINALQHLGVAGQPFLQAGEKGQKSPFSSSDFHSEMFTCTMLQRSVSKMRMYLWWSLCILYLQYTHAR